MSRQQWDALPHEHCRCGSRLVDQPYEHTRPVCYDCGYFSEECKCDVTPCESCGEVPTQ